MINIDPIKSGFENLVELIKENNGGVSFEHTFTLENIEFGVPAAYSDGGNPTANTSVDVIALLDKGYSGQVNVSYYRPSLTEVHTTPAATIEIDTSIATEISVEAYEAAVKAAVADKFGLIESEFEFDTLDPLPVPENENSPVTIDIKPVDGSLVYFGDPMAVTWAAVDDDLPLDEVITTTALLGFTI